MARKSKLQELLRQAKDETTSPEILLQLAQSPIKEVRRAVAINPQATLEVHSILARDKNPGVRCAVSAAKTVDRHILSQLASDANTGVRRSVTQNQTTSADTLQTLSSDPDVQTRCCVGRNVSSWPQTLLTLARDREQIVRLSIIGNPSTPLEAYRVLAEASDYRTRNRLAKAAPLIVDLFKDLALDSEISIRTRVAYRSNLNEEMLVWLLENGDQDVKLAVARRSNNSERIFQLLLRLNDDTITEAVTWNKGLPVSSLLQIYESAADRRKSDVKKEEVFRALSRNPNTPKEILHTILRSLSASSDHGSRCSAASNASTPSDCLAVLTKDESFVVREYALWNAATPPENRTDAIKTADPAPQIRAKVARNTASSPEVLALLANDADLEVQRTVARNRRTPQDVLVALASREHCKDSIAGNPSTPKAILSDLWRESKAAYEPSLSMNTSCDPEILDELSRHENYWIRRHVMYNTATTTKTLQALAAADKSNRREIKVLLEKRRDASDRG
jgi:hypothetical protein